MADVFPGATLQQSQGFFPRNGIDKARALSVIHITAGLGSAATIAKAVEAKQVTASFWTNRDGSAVQAMADPWLMGPWTNGILNRPDLSNARIARIVSDGVNPNIRCLVTIENVGLEPGSPITAAQEATCARIIAYYHKKYGIPITRETVVGHYQFDSVNRPNCPSTNKSIIDRIVAMANGEAIPVEDKDDVYTQQNYPWPRNASTKGGSIEGYKYSPDPNKTFSFAAGSGFQTSAEVTISPTPPEWLAGPYQLVLDGPMAGYLVANSQIALGIEPEPLPAPPADTVDCTEAVKAATDPLMADIAVQKALLAESERHVATLKQLISDHNAVEQKMAALNS